MKPTFVASNYTVHGLKATLLSWSSKYPLYQRPAGLAIGRLGVALSDHRDPRLVVDSSVCGTNSSCQVLEQGLPTVKDVLRTFPLRDNTAELGGLSLDIKAVQKRIVIRESERGLLGFSHNGSLYFYRVAPFGAIFSAHWWGRLGGFLTRFLHLAIYVKHALWLYYVDDFLLCQRWDVLPLTATFIIILLQLFGIPISWKKYDLSKEITWIGWQFHFSSGIVTLDINKRSKLIRLISSLQHQSRVHKKDLERFIGLAMWITQLFTGMRQMVQYFYADLFSLSASHYSIDPGHWQEIISAVSDTLIFLQPPGTGIPIGGQLISVRHQTVKTKQDLNTLRLGNRQIWMGITNPSSNKRKISEASARCLSLFDVWLKHCIPLKSMYPKKVWPGLAAADACAMGTSTQIGRFIQEDTQSPIWFSEKSDVQNFLHLDIPVRSESQKDIGAYETLAQMALLFIFARQFPTKPPLSLFLEKLGLMSSILGVDMDTSHISGVDNETADELSRWDFQSPLPPRFNHANRIRIDLKDMWLMRIHPIVVPPSTYLAWNLPT